GYRSFSGARNCVIRNTSDMATMDCLHINCNRVVLPLRLLQTIPTRRTSDRVVPAAVLIDAGAAISSRAAQREDVRVARVDVAERDLPARALARAVVAFGNRRSEERRGGQGWNTGRWGRDLNVTDGTTGRALRHVPPGRGG